MSSVVKVRITKLTCQRCEYEWHPRIEDVRQCPSCKSARWEQPKPVPAVSLKG
jgi:predicted Zn-ribbon and HTH transcriptional regulator